MFKFSRWFNNLSLYKKILLIVSSGLVCIYIVFWISIQLLITRYDNTLYKTNASLLDHATSSMDSDLSAVETISTNILIHPSIQNQLTSYSQTEDASRLSYIRGLIHSLLLSYSYDNAYIRSIILILPDGSSVCVGNPSDLDAVRAGFGTLEEQIDQAQGKAVWSSQSSPVPIAFCGRQIRQIQNMTMDKLASLYITVDISGLVTDALGDTGFLSQESTFVLMDGETQLYPELPFQTELCRKLLSETFTGEQLYAIRQADDRKNFIVCGSLNRYGWRCLYFQDYDSIFRQINQTKLQVVLLSIIFGVLIFLLAYIAIQHILRHMNYLIQKIRCFGSGIPVPKDIGHYRYENRTDEIGQLHQAFDEMTTSVKVLRDENYDKQLLLQDATIKMLRQQINPHFLYNTLDTINWLAQKHHAEEISTIALSLGHLFRSTISGSSDFIPLAEELRILDDYLQIQRIRFKDRLDFRRLLPKDISHIYVPKLCIQPLVENALKYAMEVTDDPCVIRLVVEERESDYLITVSNTGSQFEENLLQKIRNQEIRPQGSGVGLVNIDSRLKLLYGGSYGLHFYNQNGMAVVMLSIPKEHKPEEEHVKTVDC